MQKETLHLAALKSFMNTPLFGRKVENDTMLGSIKVEDEWLVMAGADAVEGGGGGAAAPSDE